MFWELLFSLSTLTIDTTHMNSLFFIPKLSFPRKYNSIIYYYMQRLKIVFPQIVYDNNTNTNHKNVNPIYHNRRFGKEKKIERVLKGASKND